MHRPGKFVHSVTKSGGCSFGACVTISPARRTLWVLVVARGLPSMGSTLLGVLFVSSCDLWPAHSACRSTCGDANTPSLLPSTQPQCCRMWMMLSSSRSALETTETSLTPPACRWLPPPSTAGQSLMVGEAAGDLGHRVNVNPCLLWKPQQTLSGVPLL